MRDCWKLGVNSSHDLLSQIMALEAHGAAVDNKYLCDIVVNFLLAGHGTLSSSFTTIFMLLSKNPTTVDAIRVEATAGEMAMTAS